MAKSGYRCQKCGRTFTGMKVADTIRGVISLLAFVIIIFGLIEFTEEEPLIPGITLGSINTIISAIVVLVLVNVAANQTIKDGSKKYGTNEGLMCPGCKVQNDAAKEQKKVEEQSEAMRWQAELKAILDSEPSLQSIVKEWSSINNGATPSRGTIEEIRTAMNLEKAGNYEGAAKIYENQKLWTFAGKAREKSRVQMIKHVTVDMNQLIEQIGTKGLAIPYRCNNCGASITIDKNSSASGLQFCSYCGTAYNVEEMSKIVQEALEI